MTPNDPIYAAWQFDPVLIGGILAVAWRTSWRPVRCDRGSRRASPTTPGGAAWFYGALVLFFVVEGSPLHDLAERYLLSAHMVQHLLLSYVVARMLIVGVPAWLWRAMLTHPRVYPSRGSCCGRSSPSPSSRCSSPSGTSR
jgi:putative membrane protein